MCHLVGIVARGYVVEGKERLGASLLDLAKKGSTATTAMASPIVINSSWPERPATCGLPMPITVSTAATVTIQTLIPDLEPADADDRGATAATARAWSVSVIGMS